jgi:hypothetical protein
MVAGRPAHVASAPKLCPKGVVVELKREIMEGKGGEEEGDRPTTNLWPTDHACPPLNPYFHPSHHLAPIMLTPLIKSKVNSFKPFSKFFLFIYFYFFRFYIIQ